MHTFYLGTHIPTWLKTVEVPLFISRRLLYKRKTFPRAKGRWALDSGGFTELNMYNRWITPAKQYAKEVRLFSEEIGNLDWAAIQDWMCEPIVLKKTGLTIQQHQSHTVNNFVELMLIDSTLPWIPVLQGWAIDDYLSSIEQYDRAGINIFSFPFVAVGSVCRRQGTDEAGNIFKTLSELGLKLHGFGLKTNAIRKYKQYIYSSDSLAWSFDARYGKPLLGHTHPKCNNCLEYAYMWRNKIMDIIKEG